MWRVFGGVPPHSRKVTRLDQIGELREIDCGYQGLIALPDVVERIVGVDDEPVDKVGNRLGHIALPTGSTDVRTMRATISLRNDNRCSADANGTTVAGIRASGSSEIASVVGDTNSSRTAAGAAAKPIPRATTRSTRPKMLNHTARRLTTPRRRLRATNTASAPIAMSPSPAGRANTAGSLPNAITTRKVTPTTRKI